MAALELSALVLANHDGLAEGLLVVFVAVAVAALVGVGVLGWTVMALRRGDVRRCRQLAVVNGALALGTVGAFLLVESADASKLLVLTALFGAAGLLAARARPKP